EDDPERMIGPQPAEREPRNVEIQRRPSELCRREYPDRHPDDPPDGSGEQKEPDHMIVVGLGLRHVRLPPCTGASLHPARELSSIYITGGSSLFETRPRACDG